MNYTFNKNDNASLQVFYNPVSYSLKGIARYEANFGITDQEDTQREYSKMIYNTYCSLDYRHVFNEKGSDLEVNISDYHLNGDTKSTCSTAGVEDPSEIPVTSTTRPLQNTAALKIDLNLFLSKELKLSVGGKVRWQTMEDLTNTDFKYTEKMYAAYSSIGCNKAKYDWNAGFRFENSFSELKNSIHASQFSLLPFVVCNIKLPLHQAIKLSLSRTVRRPDIFQLNPTQTMDSPFTLSSGNPSLKPEFRTVAYAEYSKSFNSNFISLKSFYNCITDAINNLTLPYDTILVKTSPFNLGTIHQYGMQISGSMEIDKLITFTPYLRLYGQYTEGNTLAMHYSIKDRNQLVAETGISAIASFKYDISLIVNCVYNSPRNNIQDNNFSDALYFVTLQKIFKKSIKVGVTSGLAFTKNFTYSGSEIKDPDFSSYDRGTIHVPDLLLMFNLNYSFHSGKKAAKIRHAEIETDPLPQKGF